MNWLPLSLGVVLGGGVLVAWYGFQAVRAAGDDRKARSRAMWRLNLGVLMAVVSMGAMMMLGK